MNNLPPYPRHRTRPQKDPYDRASLRAISRGRRRPIPVASVIARVRRAKPGEIARPAAGKRERLTSIAFINV